MRSPLAAELTLTAALCAALAAPRTAGAGGFILSEIGHRRTAMAAVVGRPDEPAATVHNPAGLTLLPGVRAYVSFGVALIGTEFRVREWERSTELLGVEPDAGGYYPTVTPNRAGAVIPMIAITGELWRGRLFGGASLYVSNATGSSFDENAVTRYHMIEGYLVGPVGAVSVAYKVSDELAIGASYGRVNLRLHARRNVFPIVSGNDVSAIVGAAPELVVDGSDWVSTWNVGVLVRPSARVSIGVALTARSDAVLEGPLTVRYSDDAPAPDTLEGYHRTNYLLPWTATVGVNVDVSPRMEIGGEARYWRYSDYDEQRSEVDGIFLLRELVVDKDFHDSYQVSGGVRVHGLRDLPGVELMAGAHFDQTPAPTRTLTLDQPTFSSVGFHTGARYERGRYRVGLSYIRYVYLVPTVTDSATTPPSNFTGSGATNIITTSAEITFGDAL